MGAALVVAIGAGAPDTFDTQKAAADWLVEKQAEILRSEWIDPDAGSITLVEYADRWVKDRDLKPRTRVEYERTLRLHVKPQFAERLLNGITPPQIRAWRSDLLAAGVGRPTVNEDLPHSAGHLRHRTRRRPDTAQSLPDQGSRAGHRR
ncbi:N-terminal phage integrase SAM-like domain-containing protein [Catellatospora citrea]|uniref:Core-binding (CB) domain-containing protein n=1 Tax=Catellatospora citrea TaxID=53366 RepID=A0A8J3NZY9_9ACTN|nr:N-terminal phage integrase SAM-like domain-containing protein [Catellatospora citrea]GIF98336.1 hypothetical protein Cci01nite_34300 [Catellatospora citrea]